MSLELDIPYGDAFVKAKVPDHTFVLPAGGQIKKPKPVDDLATTIAAALDRPLGLPPIPELVASG